MSDQRTGSLPDDHRVNRQFSAYNDHLLDEFVNCFAPSIRCTTGDGTVRAEGHEQLRALYAPLLAIPGRRATLLNRIAAGDWVVDHELVTADDDRFEAIVAYHLVEGEIVEMRILD